MDLVEALSTANKAPKVLVWDIENSPATGKFWGPTYNTNIIKVTKPSSVICFAAKWLGQEDVIFHSDYHDGHEYMLERAWELLNEADAVVSYNGKKHDSPHISTEFLLQAWGPPSPYIHTDLYQTVRAKFKFQQNKLSFVSEQLGIGSKVAHEGFELWEACERMEDDAWNRMKEYNIGDVGLTEDLYWDLLAWIPQHALAHRGLYGFELDVCGRCGSDRITPAETHSTGLRLFERFVCDDCGGWSRGKRALFSTDLRGI